MIQKWQPRPFSHQNSQSRTSKSEAMRVFSIKIRAGHVVTARRANHLATSLFETRGASWAIAGSEFRISSRRQFCRRSLCLELAITRLKSSLRLCHPRASRTHVYSTFSLCGEGNVSSHRGAVPVPEDKPGGCTPPLRNPVFAMPGILPRCVGHRFRRQGSRIFCAS